jgi:hypothetical protein
MVRLALLLIAALPLLALGCKPELLPGTTLEDNAENRGIMHFLAHYEEAMESRSVDRLMRLVADDYFEDSGTIDASDDYGYEQLRDQLQKSFEHTKVVHLEIFLQHVGRDNERGLVLVDYRYRQRALLNFESGEKWVNLTDVNRVSLRPVEDKDEELRYRIVSGL